MKQRVRYLISLALFCAACGGSSSGNTLSPVPLNSTVMVPGLMTTGRNAPGVALKSGDILLAGGFGSLNAVALGSGEIYHPATDSFSSVSNQLAIPAIGPVLAALNDGTALVGGGRDNSGTVLVQAEIYNPATNSFIPTKGVMNQARYAFTATTLQDGTVLVAGGDDGNGDSLNTAEIYNPATGRFSFTAGTMINARTLHQAALLPNGKVLLAGGIQGTDVLSTAELYDPSSGTFSVTAGELSSPRFEYTMVMLSDGRVLLAGGAVPSDTNPGTSSTAEVYDPNTSTFSPVANDMSTGRRFASGAPLPEGNAIICGGSSAFPNQIPDATCDLFDAATNSFSPAASLHIARMSAAAAVLPDGSPIFLGGIDNQGTSGGNYEPSGEIYHAATQTFSVTGGLNALRVAYASTLLHDGRVLIAGGANQTSRLDTAEVFDPKTGHFIPTSNNLDTQRVSLNAVTLSDGKVLITGGSGGTTADLFDPVTMKFSLTPGSMVAARSVATATLLRDGTVLIAGGIDPSSGDSLDSAELYDPSTGTFSATSGKMTSPRALHTATLLANGEVLLAGGSTSSLFSGALDTAELYNPAAGTFTAVAHPMTSARASATANLLHNGQVLIAGGAIADGSSIASAELFDPKTGTFTAANGAMSNARAFQSAVTLHDGRVMVAGGSVVTLVGGALSTTSTDTVDFYNPASGTFTPGIPMLSSRDFFVATALKDGKVLIPGGRFVASTGVGIAALETAEIYTP